MSILFPDRQTSRANAIHSYADDRLPTVDLLPIFGPATKLTMLDKLSINCLLVEQVLILRQLSVLGVSRRGFPLV
jgi:hypothetical protein